MGREHPWGRRRSSPQTPFASMRASFPAWRSPHHRTPGGSHGSAAGHRPRPARRPACRSTPQSRTATPRPPTSHRRPERTRSAARFAGAGRRAHAGQAVADPADRAAPSVTGIGPPIPGPPGQRGRGTRGPRAGHLAQHQFGRHHLRYRRSRADRSALRPGRRSPGTRSATHNPCHRSPAIRTARTGASAGTARTRAATRQGPDGRGRPPARGHPDDGLSLRFTRDQRAAQRPLLAVRGSDRFRVFVVRHISMVGTPGGAGKDTHTLLTDQHPFLTWLMRGVGANGRSAYGR